MALAVIGVAELGRVAGMAAAARLLLQCARHQETSLREVDFPMPGGGHQSRNISRLGDSEVVDTRASRNTQKTLNFKRS